MTIDKDILHERHILFLHLWFPLEISLQGCKLFDRLLPGIWQTLALCFKQQWDNPVVSVIYVDTHVHDL